MHDTFLSMKILMNVLRVPMSVAVMATVLTDLVDTSAYAAMGTLEMEPIVVSE